MPRPPCPASEDSAIDRPKGFDTGECRTSDEHVLQDFHAHLEGLMNSFHILQQQYELVPRMGGKTLNFVPVLGGMGMQVSINSNDGEAEPENCDPTSEDEDVLDEEEITFQRRAAHQLKLQFHRLDKYNTGMLDHGDISALTKEFLGGWGLEHMESLIRHLDQVAPDSSKVAGRRTSSISTHTHTHAHTHRTDIDLDMFLVLMDDDSLLKQPTPRSMQRDVKKLRRAIELENIQAMYADDGHLAKYAIIGPQGKMALFWDVVPTVIIMLNAIALGLSTDIARNHIIWPVSEAVFAVCYLLEAATKFGLYGLRWYFRGRDRYWNFFDFVCLLMTLTDQGFYWINRLSRGGLHIDLEFFMVIKVIRLTRLIRLARTSQFAVELKRIFNGIVSGLKVLFWAMVLLFIIIYVFGITAVNLLGDEVDEFRNVPSAMFAIFRCVTDGCAAYDGLPLAERVRMRYGAFFTIMYVLVYMGVALLLFNLIMAVFIDNVMSNHLARKLQDLADTGTTAEVNIKEVLIKIFLRTTAYGVSSEAEHEIMSLNETLTDRTALVRTQFSILEECDIAITRAAFREIFNDRKLKRVLHEADIETANSSALFDVLDADMSGYVSIPELYHGLMRLRGPICKSEMVAMRLKIRHMTKTLQGLVSNDNFD